MTSPGTVETSRSTFSRIGWSSASTVTSTPDVRATCTAISARETSRTTISRSVTPRVAERVCHRGRRRPAAHDAGGSGPVEAAFAQGGLGAGHVGVVTEAPAVVGPEQDRVHRAHGGGDVAASIDQVHRDPLERHRQGKTAPVVVEAGEEVGQPALVHLDGLVRPVEPELGVGSPVHDGRQRVGDRRAENGAAHAGGISRRPCPGSTPAASRPPCCARRWCRRRPSRRSRG